MTIFQDQSLWFRNPPRVFLKNSYNIEIIIYNVFDKNLLIFHISLYIKDISVKAFRLVSANRILYGTVQSVVVLEEIIQ